MYVCEVMHAGAAFFVPNIFTVFLFFFYPNSQTLVKVYLYGVYSGNLCQKRKRVRKKHEMLNYQDSEFDLFKYKDMS